MARLEDLRHSILYLPPSEAIRVISGVRANRRIPKKVAYQKRVEGAEPKRKAVAKKAVNSTENLLAAINPAQAEALLALLQGGKKCN